MNSHAPIPIDPRLLEHPSNKPNAAKQSENDRTRYWNTVHTAQEVEDHSKQKYGKLNPYKRQPLEEDVLWGMPNGLWGGPTSFKIPQERRNPLPKSLEPISRKRKHADAFDAEEDQQQRQLATSSKNFGRAQKGAFYSAQPTWLARQTDEIEVLIAQDHQLARHQQMYRDGWVPLYSWGKRDTDSGVALVEPERSYLGSSAVGDKAIAAAGSEGQGLREGYVRSWCGSIYRSSYEVGK